MPKMPSEYAAISPSKQKLDEVRMSSAQDEYEEGDGRVESKEAIDKMTAKYDSLEKLRSSLEELRIVDGDDVTRSRTSINVYRFNEDNGIPSDQELAQVESFFSGHKTSVYVCPSMTSVYFSSLESHTLPIGHHHHNGLDRGSHQQQRRHSGWQLVHCGIPVLLLDSGETRSRAKRRIQIVVAERGTGFLLWRDTIDNLTNYQAIDSHFHTMYMSSDHRRLVGISFHSVAGAREFYERVERLTSDPANISLSTPNKKHRQQQHNTVNNNNNNSGGGHHKKRKKTMPKKSDISQPCCFQHVTRLEMADKDYYVTLATLTGRVHPPKANADNKTELHKYKSEPTLRINHLN